MIKQEIKNQPLRKMLHLDHAYKKINNTFIDNADDLDIVVPMYNLLEYDNNYSMTSGSLWNY